MSLNITEKNLRMEISDSTVSILPGGVRVGNVFMSYPGGQITLDQMVDFGGQSSKYQNSTLFLQNFEGVADLTSVVSIPQSSIVSLELPELPTDASNPYSPVHPIGLFTLFTDGTTTNLISYRTE